VRRAWGPGEGNEGLTRWAWPEAGERTGEGSWINEVGSRIWKDMIVSEADRMKTTNKEGVELHSDICEFRLLLFSIRLVFYVLHLTHRSISLSWEFLFLHSSCGYYVERATEVTNILSETFTTDNKVCCLFRLLLRGKVCFNEMFSVGRTEQNTQTRMNKLYLHFRLSNRSAVSNSKQVQKRCRQKSWNQKTDRDHN